MPKNDVAQNADGNTATGKQSAQTETAVLRLLVSYKITSDLIWANQ